MPDISQTLQETVKAAYAKQQPLHLQGGGSKAFYGTPIQGQLVDLSEHKGIVNYEPTELVLTARCGTPLSEIEQQLADNKQMLSFEPPYFAGNATIGGAVAAGLAGPRRPWGGAPRDALLGIKLLDGQGQIMRFGGQVMKNVAGYDVSRLMAGARGTLGILLEASIKVLPAPQVETTQTLEMPRDQAVKLMRELAHQPVPLSGACHLDNQLYLRLSGNQASITAWQHKIGGEQTAEDSTFWQHLRDQQLNFFQREDTLWRLSLPPASPRLDCEDETLTDWAGAQRWVYSSQSAQAIREQAAKHKGHAEAFRNAPSDIDPFHPLDPRIAVLQKNLKQQFDPHGIFNLANNNAP